jgi:predicted DNA-binding protein (MmcQ/YjbR family)
MILKEYQKLCRTFSGVTEEFPFDDITLVYKVRGKIFTLTNFESFETISIKCEPDDALAMRQMYKSVFPGYHLNKKHWNSITMDGEVSDEILNKMIKDSYDLVVNGLPKKIQKELSE